MVRARPRSWPSSADSCWSVPPTVFATPANSDCHWTAAVVTSARPPPTRAPVFSMPVPTRSQSDRFLTELREIWLAVSWVTFCISSSFATYRDTSASKMAATVRLLIVVSAGAVRATDY